MTEQLVPLDEIKIEAGTVIHIHGIPFKLKDDVVVLGREANLKLTQE
jgi:hypothetical protein